MVNLFQGKTDFLFQVHPASSPSYVTSILIGIVFIKIGVALLINGSFNYALFIGGMGVFMFWNGNRDHRPHSQTIISNFQVNNKGIKSNDHFFDKIEIHRLIIKNAINTNISFDRNSVLQGQRAQHQSNVADVSYSLNVESSGKSFQLAGGMDETTAFGLMTAVTRIIGFQVS